MPRPKTISPVRPSAAIEIAYRKRLDALLDEMHRSLIYWIKASYRANEPEMAKLATDDSPAANLRTAFRRLARRWTRRFDDLSDDLARYFAQQTAQRSTAALHAMLRKGGMSVRFRPMSRPVNDLVQAAVGENVALIKSIAQQHLSAVEGHVMRSVQTGRDLGTLAEALEHQFGVTKRRAALIARDQNNKATAAIVRARSLEAGITEAIWVHSHGGKVPRPSHVKAGRDKVRYKISEGWFDPHEQKHIFPGELINCFPGDMIIGLETTPTRLWRSFFDGPMVHIQIGSDLLKGTFNHPILTSRGWIPLGEIDCGDEIVCMLRDRGDMVDYYKDNRVTTFSDCFESLAVEFGYVSRECRCFDFHGDIPNGQVDEIVIVDDELPLNNERSFEDARDFGFTEPYPTAGPVGFGTCDHIAPSSPSGTVGGSSFLFDCFSLRSDKVSVTAGSHHVISDQYISNISSRMAFSPKMRSDGDCTHTAIIERDDFVLPRVPIMPSIDLDAEDTDLFAEFVGVASNGQRRVFEFDSRSYEFRRVNNKIVRDFSGHVFTMQTLTGYYSVGSAFAQAKNCRCVARPVVLGFS